MAKPISPFSIGSPGFYGLNTQDAPAGIDPGYALDATNCVIDQYGRIGARKGWARAHTSNSDLGTANVTCIGELVQNEGTTTTLAAGNGFLFKLSSTTLVTLTYGGGGVAPTISLNNWQMVTLNGIAVFFQRGYDPLIYDPVVSTTTFRRLSEKSGYTGTVPLANCAVSAYGRIWCADVAADKNTITWCDVITPHIWTAGSSGTLNLIGVWPQGGDEVVALAAHNNFLIIFGRKQTLIYSGANTPSTMTLYDSLSGIGCIARDSVQNTGEDIIFLSSSGVRSLNRTIQEKSSPLRALSRNVSNELQSYASVETLANVKSGYTPVDAFYVVTFPASSMTYCFDTRTILENGAARTTKWDGVASKAFAYTNGRKFYLGKPGYIGEYSTYYDDATAYRLTYYTPWLDFGNPIQTSILKKILATILGGTNQTIIFKWGFDFISGSKLQAASIDGGDGVSEWGLAEYGEDEFTANMAISTAAINASGSGKLAQIGIECQLLGASISIQKIDIYTKEGSYK